MNATYHWARSVSLSPALNTPDLYSLLVDYSKEYDKQFYKAVHVPPSLAQVLVRGPCGFQLETLDCIGPASRLLNGSPQFAVLAVTDRLGNHYAHCPEQWTRFCRKRSLLALGASIGAIFALATLTSWSVPAAVALSCIGAHALRDRRVVSSARPFKIQLEVGTRPLH